MPTAIVSHLRKTIEEMSDEEEANFAIYQLGIEWGRETVRISGESSDIDGLKTKAVLTAVHSGITNIELEMGDQDVIIVEPFDSKIDDDHFIAGYVSGIISELLGEYHIAKIAEEHLEITRWDKKVDDQISDEEIEGEESIELEDLVKGESYLVKDDSTKAPLTFNAFLKALEKNLPGLCMSTVFPSKIKSEDEEFDRSFPCFWLSQVEGSEDVNSIPPERFSEIAVKIATSFLEIKHGIFMLHGLEFLLEHADSNEVIKAVQTMKDLTSIHKGIFLVAVDEEKVGEKEFNLLKSELEVLDIQI